MEYALVLLIVASVAVGVVSSVVTTWSLRSRFFSLEDRVGVMEGTLLREVKSRAGQERWKKPSREEEAAMAALNAPAVPPARKLNWWTVDAPRAYNPKP